jgi:hypothetical protein
MTTAIRPDPALTLTRTLEARMRLTAAVAEQPLGAGWDWRVTLGRLVVAEGGARTMSEAKAQAQRAADRVAREVVE